ncbi:MAG: hypothetical protein WCO91_09095, partial [Gemmataceae bacterium]
MVKKPFFQWTLLFVYFTLPSVAFCQSWSVTYPKSFPEVSWLKTHQRACFAVNDKAIGKAMADGVNVVIGGTNAGG